MPIRFRCVYCEKLLGISRRKAGAIVSCPQCGEQLIVPTPGSDEGTSSEAHAEGEKGTAEGRAFAAGDGPQLFERSDFEALLQPEPTFRTGEDLPAPPKPSRAKASAAPVVEQLPSQFPLLEHSSIPDFVPSTATKKPQPPGFFISSSRLTWLSVAAVIALALVFAVGFLVGRTFRA